jgi:hypothetical protein
VSAVPPIGPRPIERAGRSLPIERVRERWQDDAERSQGERRRKRRPKPDQSASGGEVAADHVDVQA